MSTSKKIDESDRSGGGPGSSHQGGNHGHANRHEDEGPHVGEATNTSRSQVSGGGGEEDRHHSADSKRK